MHDGDLPFLALGKKDKLLIVKSDSLSTTDCQGLSTSGQPVNAEKTYGTKKTFEIRRHDALEWKRINNLVV